MLGAGGASHFDNLPLFPEYGAADWYRDDAPVEVVPELVEELGAAWEQYAEEVGVVLPEHPIPY